MLWNVFALAIAWVCIQPLGINCLQRQTPSLYNTRARRLTIPFRLDLKKKQCVVDYKYRYNFNTMVTIPRGGKCIVFYCSQKIGFRLVSSRSGCLYNNKCIKRGATITEGCTTYRCYFWSRKTSRGAFFQNLWYLQKEGCLNRGKCLAMREEFLDEEYCGVYHCVKRYRNGKANYYMHLSENRCPYLGSCLIIDKRYVQQFNNVCTLLQCKYKKTNEGNITLRLVEQRCQEPDGSCSRPGIIKQADDCYRAVCKTLPDGRAFYYTQYRNTLACRTKYG